MKIEINSKTDSFPFVMGKDKKITLSHFKDYEQELDEKNNRVIIRDLSLFLYFDEEDKLSEAEVYQNRIKKFTDMTIDGVTVTFKKTMLKALQNKGHEIYIDNEGAYLIPSLNITLALPKVGMKTSFVFASDDVFKEVMELMKAEKIVL